MSGNKKILVPTPEGIREQNSTKIISSQKEQKEIVLGETKTISETFNDSKTT